MSKVIYYLSDYNWEHGELISEGPKNYKIEITDWKRKYTRVVAKEKCAFPGEQVAVIWEKWKGKNGRGGYRVERELYPTDRVAAEQVGRQHFGRDISGRVSEVQYGVRG